jgi:SHS2 domain-containing protein
VTPAGYEHSRTGATLRLTAWGEDLPECLRQCALGVFALIIPAGSVRPLEGREVAARGASPEALLASWLDECLYVHVVEGFLVAEVDRPEVQGARLHAVLRGEPADLARHPPGPALSVASSEGLEVCEEPGRVIARVTLHT